MSNLWEQQKRAEKAFALATHLHSHGIAADDAGLMTDADWCAAAQSARVKVPSPMAAAEAVRMLGEIELAGQAVVRVLDAPILDEVQV